MIQNNNVTNYLQSTSITPLFIHGNTLDELKMIPSSSIDCCMTSPPYWGKRQYATEGIGLEEDYYEYINTLLAIFLEVKRVIKNTGSLWLNIGDAYKNKNLLGIPWRIALKMMDEQAWILRNEIISF